MTKCSGITLKGTKCKKLATEGKYCHIHDKSHIHIKNNIKNSDQEDVKQILQYISKNGVKKLNAKIKGIHEFSHFTLNLHDNFIETLKVKDFKNEKFLKSLPNKYAEYMKDFLEYAFEFDPGLWTKSNKDKVLKYAKKSVKEVINSEEFKNYVDKFIS